MMETMRLLSPLCRQSSSLRRRFLRLYSTQNPQQQEVVVREKINLTKPSPVKWKRPPFLKNFFLGKFDTELLVFPEILTKEQVEELEANVSIITDIMKKKANPIEIEKNTGISKDLLQDLKELGLFGRLIPAKYGGLELSYTACTRLNEALSLDWSVCSTLAAHEFFASQVLLKFGTEQQKLKYLPQLASGKLIAAFCCTELESGGDPMSISTVAKQLSDGSYEVSGTKIWVTNGEIADIFVVFVKTPHTLDIHGHEYSVFLIHRDMEGVTVVPQDNICLHGTHSAIVNLKEVIVPLDNVIGTAGIGVQAYIQTLDSLRFGLNTFTFGTLKALLDIITDRMIHNERYETSLSDQQLVRRRISKINNKIYAMESMAYFTAALIDSTENPEVSMEKSALKIFNTEGTLYCLREMQSLIGSSSLMNDLNLEKFYRDAKGLSIMDGQNDVARLYISLNSLREFGFKESVDIIQMRNPFSFPYRRIKEMWRHFLIQRNIFRFDQDIGGHVHPSLVEWADHLERNLYKLETTVRNVLTLHGKDAVNTQIDPWKLSEIAVYMYAMSAVLARGNRSYCIGLKNTNHELEMVNTICYDATSKIFRNINDIALGVNHNNETNHLVLGEQVIDCKGYFAEHPLKHNF